MEWVQCEMCDKWRRLPPNLSAADLPDTDWYCAMNTWDKSTASCDANEIEDEGVDNVENATSMPGHEDESATAIDITEDDLDDGLERDRRGKIIRPRGIVSSGGAAKVLERDKWGKIIKTCRIAGCQYRTGYTSCMKSHKAAQHGIDVIWHSCDQVGCNFKAKEGNYLKKHRQFVHDIGVRWYHCDQDGCDYKAKEAGSIKAHKRNVHDIDVKWHRCDQYGCNYKAKEVGNLKRHRAGVHDIDVQWFKCDQDGCNFWSKEAGNIKQHKRRKHSS
ncbi:hypothetical protein TrST_g12059 [Triparma strigata]|uniref:CW-type domain-containing protein n=1 Tax=Triparma strigata TaxID=1606541 RepID=A0A9W7AIF9_9STRA|nr:hypothetical protein TrST_g12059 [Triparma strigata]